MKYRFPSVFLTIFSLFSQSLFAQGTAFTYQGRINNNGLPATGIYDLRFTIYDAASNGTLIAGPQTNSASAVTNGLFTVTLDFGADVFNGASRWLEIGVRTNGGGSFQILNSRQTILAAPYAITASNLTGTLPASQLTGAISSGQLSGTYTGAVTFSNALNSFNGAFTGNGAGLTNLSLPAGSFTWNTVSGATQQTAGNNGYLVTNIASETALTLPISPSVGDTIRVASSGAGGWKMLQNSGQSILAERLTGIVGGVGENWIARETSRNWNAIASSADGTKLVSVVFSGRIYTSVDSGVTWSARDSTRSWTSVAASADGTKLVAAVLNGHIYTSINSGTNWVAHETNRYWLSVASSSDGTKLVAVEADGQIYTSINSGTTWTPQETERNWYSVASSADGTKLVAVENGGQIYTSINSGVDWTARDTNRYWLSVASSADGTKLVAVEEGGQIYTSINSGVDWTARDSSGYWSSVASSADGTKLVALQNGGQIYISADSGETWTARDASREWYSAASSADGNKIVAVVHPGQIYTSQPQITQPAAESTTTTGVNGYLSGGRNSALELLYIGNNQFMPVSFIGSVLAH